VRRLAFAAADAYLDTALGTGGRKLLARTGAIRKSPCPKRNALLKQLAERGGDRRSIGLLGNEQLAEKRCTHHTAAATSHNGNWGKRAAPITATLNRRSGTSSTALRAELLIRATQPPVNSRCRSTSTCRTWPSPILGRSTDSLQRRNWNQGEKKENRARS